MTTTNYDLQKTDTYRQINRPVTTYLSQSDCCTNPKKTSTSSLRLIQQSNGPNQTRRRRLPQEKIQPRLSTTETTDPRNEDQTNNCYDGDSTIHQGNLRNHRTNLTTTRYPRCSQTNNDFTTATYQPQEQSGTKGQTGSGIQDQMLHCPATYIGETGRNLNTRLTEQRRATKNDDNKNNISENNLQKDHKIDWDSVKCILFSTNYYRRLTLESWFTNAIQPMPTVTSVQATN